jgi:2-polyprenyl-3-methyl-5-hydroxy-6-metoxy-1,4-benzoquinol methylase
MEISSPITQKNNVIIEKQLEANDIIFKYKKNFQIDVSRFFNNFKKINICKCLDTGYLFYYPFIGGDFEFYEYMQKFPWYYMDGKWEHKIASNLIDIEDKTLEIGSGNGNFISMMKKKNINVTGLEFNKELVNDCVKRCLEVKNQTIEDFSKSNHGKFDTVCSFQVLEHIPDVRSFFESSLTVLKVGGKLILSVPNCNPYSPIIERSTLNLPPHHAGLWDMNSLLSLQRFFDIRLERIEIEPVQPYHYEIFVDFFKKDLVRKYGFFGKVINKTTRPFTLSIIKKFARFMIGHSILVQYRKI